MKRKIVSGVVMTIVCVSMIALAFTIQPAETWDGGTIYIRADGSVDPPTAPINRTNHIYTLFDDIEITTVDGIVVEKNNVILDGAGYTIEGAGDGYGITLSSRTGITIKNITIKTFSTNIHLSESSHCNISQTNVRNAGEDGIYLHSSSDNMIASNTITNNDRGGIILDESIDNTISANTITSHSMDGIVLTNSSVNMISGNTVSNNWDGIVLTNSSVNMISGNTVSNNWEGISFYWSSGNNTTSGNRITSNDGVGITLCNSSANMISGNTVANNLEGIILCNSSADIISGNTVASHRGDGIKLCHFSDNNTISGNIMGYNGVGVETYGNSSGSYIHHNNFLNNTVQAFQNCLNSWDDGAEGNWWSDYEGVDMDRDGIGDTETPHHKDQYPLMEIVRTRMPTDLNADGKVDTIDIAMVGLAFDSKPGDSHWNVTTDLDMNGWVNIIDVAMVGKDYGKTA